MKGASMLETLRRFGVTSSFSRPGVSNDNAYAEALFRTFKLRDDRGCEGVGVVLQPLVQHRTQAQRPLKFTTPLQRHTGEATAILEHRQQVYRKARATHVGSEIP